MSLQTYEELRDLKSAAELLCESWSDNRQSHLLYTSEFLAACFAYPASQPPVAPALYLDNKLAAFVCGFPRTVKFQGQTRSLLLMTFFTVASQFKGRGHGSRIWSECIRRARQLNYDGIIYYCEAANISNQVTAAGCRKAGCEAAHVFTVRYLMRLLKPISSAQQTSSIQQQFSDEGFMHAASRIFDRVPLARLWSSKEADWQCTRRQGAICVTDMAGSNAGVLTGYLISIDDERRTTTAQVEDILWDTLSPERRLSLLEQFVSRCTGAAQLIAVPVLQYADMNPFIAAGFRRSNRILNAYIALWEPAEFSQLPAMYMDVL